MKNTTHENTELSHLLRRSRYDKGINFFLIGHKTNLNPSRVALIEKDPAKATMWELYNVMKCLSLEKEFDQMCFKIIRRLNLLFKDPAGPRLV